MRYLCKSKSIRCGCFVVVALFSMFFGNNSSPYMRRSSIGRTFRRQVQYFCIPDASIWHTFYLTHLNLWGRAPPPSGGNALKCFSFFCLSSFYCARLKPNGLIVKNVVQAGSWWPQKAMHVPWHFQLEVTWVGWGFPFGVNIFPSEMHSKIVKPHTSNHRRAHRRG